MKKIFMWFLLLNKRLYKKITYIAILLLIPVFVAIFSISAKEPSGIVTIALANENPNNVVTKEIIQELKRDTKVISFQELSPEMAKANVSAGKVDAAWIFPADMTRRVMAYINHENNCTGFITVIEREQTIPLMLSREKLSSAVHTQVVKQTFLKHVREVAPEAANASDQELLDFLYNADVSGELFEFRDIDGNERNENVNYLTAPIRGILAVLVAVCAMVTAMYYQNDLDHGIFALLPERKRVFAEFGYQMISAINIMVFVVAALLIAGLGAALWKEIVIFLLVTIGSSLFGMLMRMIFGGRRGMAVMIPVMTIVMMVVCPVFFDFDSVRLLQYVLPPTYFINCAFNKLYFLYLAIYDLALFIICFGYFWLQTKLPKTAHAVADKVKEAV